jgi:hypothetical protein
MELAETEAQYLSTCLGLMWAAVGCGFVAFAGECVEWDFQPFTPTGERVDARWKARGVLRVGGGRSGGFRR